MYLLGHHELGDRLLGGLLLLVACGFSAYSFAFATGPCFFSLNGNPHLPTITAQI